MLRRLVLVLALVGAASTAHAATYYAKNTGGGYGVNCTQYQTISTPSQTIAAALSCMSGGGNTVLVRAGTYNEHLEPGMEGLTWASGTSWANKNRLANYPNGCSPRAANPCGTPGEDVILAPHTSTITGNGISFGVYADLAYIEIDGINIDMSQGPSGYQGDYSFPWSGIIGGAVAVTCYQSSGQGATANYIRLQNFEMIGLDGYFPDNVRGQAISFFHYRSSGAADPRCPGGYEAINLKIHGGATDETGWSSCVPSSGNDYCRYTAYAFYINSDNTLVERNEIYDIRGIAIQLNASGGYADYTGVIIRGNVIHDLTRGLRPGDTTLVGIIIAERSNGALIANNVIYSIGVSGYSYGIYEYVGTNSQFYNDTVYGVIGAGIATGAGASNATIRNNIAYNNSISNYVNSGSGTTASTNSFIGTDPGFEDGPGHNFHLAMGSGSIDVGVCLAEVTSDYDGVARPQGVGCDIGAYEYLAAGSLPGVVACTPANGATGVDLFPSIVCSSSGATSFDVYFGLPGDTNTPLVSSTFTAPNSLDIGATFSPYAAVGITSATLQSNRVRSVSTSAYSVEAVTSTTLAADQWCRVQVVTLANATQNLAGCVLRGSTPTTLSGYLVGVAAVNQTGSWIARITNGLVDAYLALDSVTVWAVNDRVEARAVGSTIGLYRYPSTTPILSVTDTTYATGRVGLMLYTTTVGAVELDNFEAGNLGLPFIGNQASGTYAASSLPVNTLHQYQFIAKNGVGDTPGPLNSFTTLGTTATPVGIRLRCVYGTANCP